MGSKLILLLGLLVGAFLTFMCVNENKTALSLKYNQIAKSDTTLQTIVPATSTETITVAEESKPTAETDVVELDDPKFSYSLKDNAKLSVKLASKDKTPELEEFILSYCPADSCTQDLSFDENTKDAKWQKDALKIAAFLKDKNIKNGVISMGDNYLNIEGELKNEEDMKELNQLLSAFDPEVYKMENITTVAPSPKVVAEKPKEDPVAQVQDEIKELLKANPIYFKFNSSLITQEGKKTLNRVIALLKGVENISLRVEGHTDSGGRASYNKLLSQKRADSVKNYLIKNGNFKGKIEAIGFGEERPISSNTKDKINRRVEIYLKRGE